MMSSYNIIPAKHFVQMLAANVNNKELSDEAFRELVRNSVPIVEGGAAISHRDHEFSPGVRVLSAGSTV